MTQMPGEGDIDTQHNEGQVCVQGTEAESRLVRRRDSETSLPSTVGNQLSARTTLAITGRVNVRWFGK